MDNKQQEKQFRDIFETQIREHILGPGFAKEIICCKEDASDEIVDDDPRKLYTTGVLYPPKTDDNDGVQDDDEGNTDPCADIVIENDNENLKLDDDDEDDQDSTTQQHSYDDRDRSANSDRIGLITCIDEDCKKIKINLRYAKYHKLKGEDKKKVRIKLEHNYDKLNNLLSEYDKIEDNKKAEEYISIDEVGKMVSLKNVDYHPKLPKVGVDLENANYVFKKLFGSNFYQREERTAEHILELGKNMPSVECEDYTLICRYYSRKKKGGRSKRYLKVLIRNNNRRSEEKTKLSDAEMCLFQMCARVTPVDGKLITYTDPVNYVFDSENNETEYVYRKVVNYGKGVGCAVNWDVDGNWIETAYIPSSEVKRFSNKLDERYCGYLGIDENKLKELNEACKLINLSHWNNDDNYLDQLDKFVEGYGKWVAKQKEDAEKESGYKTISDNILNKQDELHNRLNENIAYLRQNKTALECFKLANTAMLIQMMIARNPKFKKNRDIGEISEGKEILNNIEWFKNNGDNESYRPFQLAFLLMNVKSTFEDDDKYRNESVDLIWFPTGGGKTEAYLALTALTIIARRKTAQSEDEAKGVSVIMRYTLRLLTTQQFERASYLICALEFMRKVKAFGLGNNKITIGCWIGQENGKKRRDYRDELSISRDKKGGMEGKRNPFPVTYCPWCGGRLIHEIEKKETVREKGRDKDVVVYRYNHGYINDRDTRCLNENCFFGNGIPIQYVDEALYQSPPTLLLATVDKFANIANNRRAAEMLGWNTDTMSPDLIIQDELHLISGPLGSMVGFFEMVVEKIASKGGRRPKIIASTATTRNTELQIKKLYNRNVNIFPAQGITYDDNFFSHVEDDSLRRHIGICPQAYPVKAEIRIIVQLILAKISLLKKYLQEKGIDMSDTDKVNSALLEKDKEEYRLVKEIDNYWSLVLYYNSLKDLGRTRSRVAQEIFEVLRNHKIYLQIPPALDFVWNGIDKRVQEFTSRMDRSQIKEMLTRAETQASMILDNGGLRENWSNLDLVLASNMISVGIDVGRWNVMLISGQPRSNSEYIQSSSRVARNHMGLVVNTYSPQRIREYSMFENFTSYHEAYYKYVEPVSLTPVTMQILKNDVLNNVKECYKKYLFNNNKCKNDIIINIKSDLKDRFGLGNEIVDYVANELDSRWDDYNKTVTSLRVVDPNCYTYIKDLTYPRR